MTVLHLIPTLGGGGAERQLSLLAREQAFRGFDVHVGVRKGDGVHRETLSDAGVVIHELGDLKGVSPSLLFRIWRLVENVRPSVIQTWLPQMDILGGTVALIRRIRWVLSERTTDAAYAEFDFRNWLRGRLGRYAVVVVANSAGGMHYWINIRRGPRGIHKVPNAVDVGQITELCKTTPSLSDKCGTNVVLVVGRMVESKGYSTVVEAVGLVAEKHLFRTVFVGEGPFKSVIESQIEKAGLGRSISLIPYHSTWWARMSGATCLVSMSKLEGQPNVVLEAMAANCPLIVSDIPAHREILDETCAVFVGVGDSVGLSKAIIGIIGDPDGARQRAARALSRVRHLTVGAMADAYTALYCQPQGRRSR